MGYTACNNKNDRRKSGVSRGTVDRVIYNRPSVNQKFENAQAVIEELNYQPT